MTKVLFTVTDSNGNPEEGALIDIQLPQAGIDLAGNTILPTSIKVKTNSSGQKQVDLAAVSTVEYVAVITGTNKKRKGVYNLLVPESDEVIPFGNLVLLPPPSGVSYDAAAIAAITSERIRVQTLVDEIDSLPRFTPTFFGLTEFQNIGGTFTAQINPIEHSRSLIIVDQIEGTILIPADDTQDFKIGSSIVFIKGEKFASVDIKFERQDLTVTLDKLTYTDIKLEFPSDIIHIVKVAPNSWKLFNLGGGGGTAGGETESSIVNIYGTLGTVNTRLDNLEYTKEYFNTRLNVLETTTGQNSFSIQTINATLSAINRVIAELNTTIDQKIAEAVPGLGDIQSYVDVTEDNKDATLINAQNAANSESAAFDAKVLSEKAKDASEAAQIVVETIVGEAGVVVQNLTELKALDVVGGFNLVAIDSAFLEGVDFPNDGKQNRFYYDDLSEEEPDDIYVIAPDHIDLLPGGAIPANPGRWKRLPITDEQFEEGTLKNKTIAGEAIVGRANLDINTNLIAVTDETPSIKYRSLSGDDFNTQGIPFRALAADARAIGSPPYFTLAPAWMCNVGSSSADINVFGYTPISSGQRYYRNIHIRNGGRLRLTSPGQLILFCNGTFRMDPGAVLDVSSYGGIGGSRNNRPGGNGEGGEYYLGGQGGAGWDSSDGYGGGHFWTPNSDFKQNAGERGVPNNRLSGGQPSHPNNTPSWGNNAGGSNDDYQQLCHNWNPRYRGGAGGAGSSGDADSVGGDGGGLVIIVARNFDFRAGSTIDARGTANFRRGAGSMVDAGGGGGGVIITCGFNIINNAGNKDVRGTLVDGVNYNDTTEGGNGWVYHINAATSGSPP